MTRFDTWESYFYPETYNQQTRDGTLRNLFDERDPEVLRAMEHATVADRQSELHLGVLPIPRTYDTAHVRAIHGYLFQDVYEWAGQCRAVNIWKGSAHREFADVETGEVDRYLADVQRLVTGTQWAQLDRAEFGARAAEVYAHLNQAHPFREGNGRATKVFMEHVAERSMFGLDYSRVGPYEWNQAAEFSRPDRYAYEPVPDSMVSVFRHIAVDRPQHRDDQGLGL